MAEIITFPAVRNEVASEAADIEEFLATHAFEAAGSDWEAAIDLLNGAAEMLRRAWASDEPGTT